MSKSWERVRRCISELFRGSANPPLLFTGTALVFGKSRTITVPPGWRILTAASLDEAESVLAGEEIPVVFYDRDASKADWKQAVHVLAGSLGHPSVVLLASSGNQPGWDEVAAAGGYDVLREPGSAEAVERTLRSARSHWRNRREIETESRRVGSR